MGSSDWLGNFVRRLKFAPVGFLLVFFVASTQAADFIPAGQPIPENIRWVGDTVAGADTTASAYWRNAAGATTHSKIPVAVSKETLGKLAAGAIKRGLGPVGWAMALRDTIGLAGWMIDELSKQVVDSPSTPEGLMEPGQRFWQCSYGGTTWTSTNGATLVGCMNMNMPADADCVSTGDGGNGFWGFWCGASYGNQVLGGGISNGTQTDYGSGHTATQITDAQLGDLVKANPQIVNAILIDPETGAPIRTPELVAAINNLRRAIEAAGGLDPGPDLLPDPSYGEDGTPSQTSSEWPGFCDWATVVCDFIDWVKADDTETEPVEVPWEEEASPQQDWSSGLGGGSCPGPIAVPISIGGYAADISWEYTPLCQAATWIRQVAVPLCILLAVFIVGGYRRSASA